ncbi:MAG: hypothetical protein KC646_04145 [Candidatus Cloacimonetes bacterium]|nr:hypothetical protein [Candidatus Cloacimonadota bacterium]
MIQLHLWLGAFIAYFLALNYENFDHYNSIQMFPFEVLVLGFYNLIRCYHVFFEMYFQNKTFKVSEILGYLFYPPILFSGPLERIEEWIYYHNNSTPRDWKRAAYLLGRCLFFAILAEVFFTQFTSPNLDIKTAPYTSILLYVYFTGLVIHFRLAAYIDFSRFFSILMGYPFKRPNFNSPYSSKSVAGFWSRWNMSVARFANDYILFGKITTMDKKKVASAIVFNFLVVGICHGLNLSFVLWGGVQAIAVILNFMYLNLKHKHIKLLLWDQKFFSSKIKNVLTLTFLHLTAVLLDVRCFDIFQALLAPFANLLQLNG